MLQFLVSVLKNELFGISIKILKITCEIIERIQVQINYIELIFPHLNYMTLVRHAVQKCVKLFFSISYCVLYNDLNDEREKKDN